MTEGGSTGVPRPADQAEIVDVDEFLSEWFMHEVEGASARAVEASITSLKRFYRCLKETGQMSPEKADEVLELLRVDRNYYIELAQER